VIPRDDLEEQKRREYEAWFKTQEREQQLLEYDCSVKYVEHQLEHEHREERFQQEVTHVTRHEQHYQQQQLMSTNISSSKGRVLFKESFSHSLFQKPTLCDLKIEVKSF
jgi:hypothetical protein